MRNRTYGGVRGRKTKVGRKLLRFPPTRFVATPVDKYSSGVCFITNKVLVCWNINANFDIQYSMSVVRLIENVFYLCAVEQSTNILMKVFS